jgi:hypothetical protein
VRTRVAAEHHRRMEPRFQFLDVPGSIDRHAASGARQVAIAARKQQELELLRGDGPARRSRRPGPHPGAVALGIAAAAVVGFVVAAGTGVL